ncbi:baseplate J/gp47 family protein [Exiguobacterium sp. S3]|uniref:baseplate J/gp47 family protein n=1 Tax=Exiguobacterium sp. S3 TaxID=483245 RepID=UPI001BE90E17|nr:baseplate J/gp47 family protein [Exiguobacterium sp. S3]
MLDGTGFKRKTYNELQQEMDQRARELFGDDINTSERSPIGILIRLFAWFLGKSWELAEKVYNSGFVTKAEGVQLDNLTPLYNTQRIAEQSARTTLSFTGSPNYTILTGTQFATENDILFTLTENVTLDSLGSGTGVAYAVETGASGNVLANTITVQAEPDVDVLTVNNPENATGGREEETDSELVNRLLDSSAAGGSGTGNSIRARLLGVTGVRAASVIENNTMATVDGNEPKSIHVYVLGGESEDVAQAIFEKKSAGIGTNGAEIVNVEDASGNNQVIKFDYAVEVPIYVNADITTNNAYPADGAAQVQDAIIRYIGGLAQDGTEYNGLGMGDDVVWSKLVQTILSQVEGIEDVTLTIGKTAGSLSAANIAIEAEEVAQTDVTKVEVV